MHGQAGRSRLARATASPMWSQWPWVTSSRSQRSTESAVRGLRGLPNHGSMRIVLPPGVRTSTQAVAVPGERRIAVRDPSRTPPGSMLQRGYTRAVPATQIAQNLAFINWTVLTGLALGSFAAVVLLRRRTTATPGYLRFTTAVRARLRGPRLDLRRRAAGLARRLAGRGRSGLGRSAPGGPRASSSSSLAACAGRPAARAAGRRRARTGPALGRGGRDARVRRARAGAAGRSARSSLLVQLAVVSAAIGGVFAAMILGHWYLVTPKLPEAPLILLARVLLAVVVAPGRAVRGLDRRPAPARPTSRRSRRWSGRGRCSSGCA